MYKIKNLVFGVFALFVVMTSCNKSDVSPILDESAYTDFLFLATVADSTGTTHKAKKCNLTLIDVSSLPAAITSYVKTKYPGGTINKAGNTESGNYVVHVILADATQKGLVFDKDGKFLDERTKKGAIKGFKGEKVEVSTLSAAITSYVTTNYASSTIMFAIKDTSGGIAVFVKKADSTKVLLGFDAAGKFVAELAMKDNRKGSKKGN